MQITGSDLEAQKKAAEAFLNRLKAHLTDKIPLDTVTDWIQEKGQAANEGLFLDELVLPAIPGFLAEALDPPAIDVHDPRISISFLAESKRARHNGIASKSPASKKKYLFTKVGANPSRAVKSWWEENHQKGQTAQSCPDWAFRAPCPHAVVFEGKLFRSGGLEHARRELVNGIYECFYYRGHPETPETSSHPAWRYDYACLVAYDASSNRSLMTAWEKLNKTVKDACWGSSNLFVMVLPS